MESKLPNVLMDLETIMSKQPALEQARSAIRTLQTSKKEPFSKLVNKADYNQKR